MSSEKEEKREREKEGRRKEGREKEKRGKGGETCLITSLWLGLAITSLWPSLAIASSSVCWLVSWSPDMAWELLGFGTRAGH